MILTLLSGCSTARPAALNTPPPVLDFPRFPDPVDGEGRVIPVFDAESGTVSVPLAYWLKIAEYQITVDKVRRQYEAWMELWGRE